eukprot:scaffold11622_cov63-Phaeocystis_antarctica.AAC.2
MNPPSPPPSTAPSGWSSPTMRTRPTHCSRTLSPSSYSTRAARGSPPFAYGTISSKDVTPMSSCSAALGSPRVSNWPQHDWWLSSAYWRSSLAAGFPIS